MNSEKIITEIDHYSKDFLLNKKGFGLFEELGGFLLFNRYYVHFGGRSVVNEDQISELLDNYLENCFLSSDLCRGLAGKLWLLDNFSENKILAFEFDELPVCLKYLQDQLIILAEKRDWDNITGAFGILSYLIGKNLVDIPLLEKFISLFGREFFSFRTLIDTPEQASSTNLEVGVKLCLSHGLSGQTIILTKLLTRYPAHLGLMKLLDSMIEFMIRYKTTETGCSFFPNAVSFNTSTDKFNRTRVAWCYGDIGPSLALLRYSQAVKNSRLENEAIAMLTDISNRRGIEKCRVLDAPLCHGSSGVMHIFNRLYKETNIKEFGKSADYWFSYTTNFYEKDGLKGFSTYKPSANKNFLVHDLINGTSGIGMALLTYENDLYQTKWDSCLFLS